MFTALPPEIVLQILSYLPISALSSVSSTSRTWNRFFTNNETTIYRQASRLHGFADQQSALPDLADLSKKYSCRVISSGMSWKTLCKTRVQVRNTWNGYAPSTVVPLPLKSLLARMPPPDRVHRIKVDEKRGLLMTTSQKGGVFVTDIDTGSALFVLRPEYVHPYAHLEYSEGYMVFNRMSSTQEVWRLEDVEAPPNTFNAASQPDQTQIREFEISMGIARRFQITSQHREMEAPQLRGCFKPHALLTSPEETSASRFVYPTLLTAGVDRVHLWDVPTGRVVEVVEGVNHSVQAENPSVLRPSSEEEGDEPAGDQGTLVEEENIHRTIEDLGELMYVDHSVDHVFLAGFHAVRVFAKIGGVNNGPSSSSGNNAHPGRLVLDLRSTSTRSGMWSYSPRYDSGSQQDGSALFHYEVDMKERVWVSESRKLIDHFIAVHVSPCGSHFAALLSGCRLLLVPHFKRLTRDPRDLGHEVELYENTLQIQLGSPRTARSVYLAYEEGDGGEGRIGVVTSSAVFVIIVPPFSDPDPATPLSPPKIRIARVKSLINPACLSSVSCLMISDAGLFLNWDPMADSASDSEDEPIPAEWEEQLEESLQDLERLGDDCFDHWNSSGDLVVSPVITAGETDVSMVYAVNFLPHRLHESI